MQSWGRSASVSRALGIVAISLWIVGCDADSPGQQSGSPADTAIRPPESPASAHPAPERLASLSGIALRSPTAAYGHADLAATGPTGAELCLVWLASNGEGDRVLAARHRNGQWTSPYELSPAPGVLFAPRVVGAEDGSCYFAWPSLGAGGSSIWGRGDRAGELGPIERLSPEGDGARKPALARSGDSLWIVWESFRAGRFNVSARERGHGGWLEPIRITDSASSDLEPAIAATAAGRVWVAWVSYREGTYATGNYEIFATVLEASGQSSADGSALEPIRITNTPKVESYPSFVFADGVLALVWTEALFPVREIESLRTLAYQRWTDKQYRVAYFRDGEWSESSSVPVASGEKFSPVAGDRATAVAADDGSLWILHHLLVTRELMDRTWSLKLARLTEEGLAVPVDLSGGTSGPADPISAVWSGDELWIADVLSVEKPATSESANSWLRVQSILPGAVPVARLQPSVIGDASRRETVVAEKLRDLPDVAPRGSGGQVHHADRRLRAYFGNLHAHSDLSRDRRGFNGSPTQAFRSIYDIAQLDFAGISDHAEWLSPRDWWELQKVTEAWNQPGIFVTLPSYEWTSFEYGHRNVFLRDAQLGRRDLLFSSVGATPDDLWRSLSAASAVSDGESNPHAITIPHHPSHHLEKPMDWSFRNDRYQRVAEVFQNRGNYEYDGAPYQRTDLRPAFSEGHSISAALAQGHRLGMIASPDHGGGMGLAGVWADELTRPSIFEALHARRTFGTTGAKIELYMTVDGEPQGSELSWTGEPVVVNAAVRGTAAGLEIWLVADGEDVARWESAEDHGEFEWRDERPVTATRYYYLRVRQSDGHMGWTSPAWVSPQSSESELSRGGIE